jgi:quercetin dioxygenase-like cupin family protein
MQVMRQDELPFSNIAREFVGADHGDVGVCVILVDAPPGRGPSLHRHPYAEVFLVQEGEGVFATEDGERTVRAGDLVVIPPNTWHRFTATGDGPLRQIDIHASPSFSTEWKD